MTIRSAGVSLTVGILSGLAAAWVGLGLLALAVSVQDPSVSGAATHRGAALAALAVVFALVAAVCVRSLMAGVTVGRDGRVKVRSLTTTDTVPASDVAGIVAQPVWGGRAWRAAVVRRSDDAVLPASWTVVRRPHPSWVWRLREADARVAAAAPGSGPRAAEVLAAGGRLDPQPPAVFWTQVWQPPPGWAQPPPGWSPPPYWYAPPDWPPPPADWQWWRPVLAPVATAERLLGPETVDPVVDTPARRWLGWETVAVMAAFLVPSVAGALIGLIEDLVGGHQLDNFALPLPGHASVSLLLLVLSYVPLAAGVPMALLLLTRTGQTPRRLGLIGRGAWKDLAPGAGLAIGSYACVLVVALILSPLLRDTALSNTAHQTHVPVYFIVYAVVLSATTAITEEVFVNGYLLTRLSQRGWRPWPAFALSLSLRTSYHLYYGVAFLVTIPFGWLVTRSFQKHRRLARPVIAHFVYDATLLILAVLTS